MKQNRSWDRESGAASALLLPALLFSCLSPALAQPAARPNDSPQQDDYRISVEVDLVVLQVTVTDRAGRAVTGLRKEDFEVREDGVPQPIRFFRQDDAPVTIGLVVDHSGSMREKLRDVTGAARSFVRSSNPQDQMFVVNFNEASSLGLPGPLRFSNSAEELAAAIGDAPADGMTALYDAIVQGLHGLQKGDRDKKALVVISDGGDNASRAKLERVLALAEQSSAVIYTIGIFDENDPDRNPGVLQRLSRATGGEAFFPRKLSDTDEICRRIARELREQYSIGYPAPRAKPGAYHAVRVTAHPEARGKVSVRTRAGYLAAEAAPFSPSAKGQ